MTTPVIDALMPFSVVWKATTGYGAELSFGTGQGYYKLRAGSTYSAQVSNNTSGPIVFHRSQQQSNATRVKLAEVAPGKSALVQSIPVPFGEVLYLSLTSTGGMVAGETIEVRLIPIPITTT